MNHFQGPTPLEVIFDQAGRDQKHLFAGHFKVIIIFDLPGVLLDDEMALIITSFKTIFSHTPNSIGSEAGSRGRTENPLPKFPFNDTCHLLWTLDVKCGLF